MRRRSLYHQLLVIAFLLPLMGCQKIIDIIFPGHQHDSKCRIIEIKQDLGDPIIRTGTFYYNTSGDLDSIIFDLHTVGASFFYFVYDEQHRLIEYNTYYYQEPDNYFYKHKYVYSDDGKIIVDTARIREAGSWTQVTFPEYDSQGRVTRETGKVIEAEGDSTVHERPVLEFEYDAEGNKKRPVEVPYDDKVYFLRTSRVLMFVERDYSKNNPFTVTGYNEYDLPTGFSSGIIGDGPFLNGFYQIKYDCE